MAPCWVTMRTDTLMFVKFEWCPVGPYWVSKRTLNVMNEYPWMHSLLLFFLAMLLLA